MSSGPAFGLAVTITAAVSLHVPFAHWKLYVPGTLNPVIVVVGLVGVVMVAEPALLLSIVHVPVPVAAIVVVPPGSTAQFTFWSGPALELLVMMTSTVSKHDPEPHR